MSDVADKVKKIVVEHLGVEEDKINESTKVWRLSSHLQFLYP